MATAQQGALLLRATPSSDRGSGERTRGVTPGARPCFRPSCVPCLAWSPDTAGPCRPWRRGDQPPTRPSVACLMWTSRRCGPRAGTRAGRRCCARAQGWPLMSNVFLTWRRVLSLIQWLRLGRSPAAATRTARSPCGQRRTGHAALGPAGLEGGAHRAPCSRGPLQLTWAPGNTRVTGKLSF